MSFFNQVTLLGRLVADPDVRYTPGGIAVASLRLAVDRDFKNQEGKREVDFLTCTAWRKVAEIVAQYCKKGSLILVSGSIQQDTYEKDGEKRYTVKVVVDKIRLLGGKGNGSQNTDGTPPDESDLPF